MVSPGYHPFCMCKCGGRVLILNISQGRSESAFRLNPSFWGAISLFLNMLQNCICNHAFHQWSVHPAQ